MTERTIVVQQSGTLCVSVEQGSVPVMSPSVQTSELRAFEVAMAVSFLRSGCPRVQVLGMYDEGLEDVKQKVRSLQMQGESLEVTVDSKSPFLFSIHRA